MSGQQPKRRLAAALIVPFMLLLGLAPAQALVRCGTEDVLRARCCCPRGQAADPSLKPTCGMVQKIHAVGAVSASAERAEATRLRPAVVALLAPPASVPRPAARAVRPGAHPRPPDTPARLLEKSSFLL